MVALLPAERPLFEFPLFLLLIEKAHVYLPRIFFFWVSFFFFFFFLWRVWFQVWSCFFWFFFFWAPPSGAKLPSLIPSVSIQGAWTAPFIQTSFGMRPFYPCGDNSLSSLQDTASSSYPRCRAASLPQPSAPSARTAFTLPTTANPLL